MTSHAEPTSWGWLIYRFERRRFATPPPMREYIGCVEPVGKRFKAKLDARLVRSDAGPAGLYPTREAAVKALEDRDANT